MDVWAGSKQRILLYGYYGFQNAGDDLLFKAVADFLLERVPTALLMVRSLGVVPAYAAHPKCKFLKCEAILAERSRSRASRLLTYARALWASTKGCSHVIFGGGTLFHARGGSLANLGLIALLVAMSRLRGAKIFALGVGIGPLPTLRSRFLMSAILLASRDFVVRDVISHRQLLGIYGGGKARLASDLVFSLPLDALPDWDGRGYGVIGLTIAPSEVARALLKRPSFPLEFKRMVVSLIDAGWEVRLLSFQELDANGDKLSDFATFDQLGLAPLGLARVRVSGDTASLASQFSELSVIAGMRFHGHVVAAMLGRPFVGFGSENKLVSICGLFGMPFVPLDTACAKDIAQAIETAIKLRPSAAVLAECRRLAGSNFSVLDRSFH